MPYGATTEDALPSSFRDPSGFVFRRDGTLYRQVAPVYEAHYRTLMESGLYQELLSSRLVIPHDDLGASASGRLLQPEPLPFISYPYEWCFGQLQDAALATLAIQRTALRFGMSLKDASAYNIQFHRGLPVLIDTLSFETVRDGAPWIAYRQFCEFFLAPLALMALVDIRLGSLLRVHLDGIPLDLAARMLPLHSRFKPALLAHVHLHAGAQRRALSGRPQASETTTTLSRSAILGMLDSLEAAVRSLRYQPRGTVWADYYAATNYDDDAQAAKARLVAEFLDLAAPRPSMVWDLGANTGRFSRLASEREVFTVAIDSDPAAVERAYRDAVRRGDSCLLPLIQDLTNPSPDQGWAQQERDSLLARGPADIVLALALEHHLALGAGVPLRRIAQFFAHAGRWLIVEFVPRDDSQAQRLLARRTQRFDDHTEAGFEAAFAPEFECVRRTPIPGTRRTLYLMRRRRDRA
jgi:hypothetical protein